MNEISKKNVCHIVLEFEKASKYYFDVIENQLRHFLIVQMEFEIFLSYLFSIY